MEFAPILILILTLSGCCTHRMDTVKVLNSQSEPIADVTVSRVQRTLSMLPEEAITGQNGIAKFEYKMCMSDDFNCWISDWPSRKDEAPRSQQVDIWGTGTVVLPLDAVSLPGPNRFAIEDDSSLTFIID